LENAEIYDVSVAHSQDLRIQIEHHKEPNYALTLSGFPLIRSVSIVNQGSEPAGDLTIDFHLATAANDRTSNLQLLVAGPHTPGSTVKLEGEVNQKNEFSAVLSDLQEATHGNITVTVTQEYSSGEMVEEIAMEIPLEFRATNEFLNFPGLHGSLATFIQPNAHEITPILRAASDLLHSKTGDGALDGYQRGNRRAYQIAGALYEALRKLQATYINPPASFENTGQKVRTTRQVVQQKFGTCIDLSVLYAAVLEAAGLHPLVFITETHAFVGFYATEYYGEHVVTTDPNTISNLVDSNLVIPVELTGVNPGSKVKFKAAVKLADSFFTGRFETVRALTDVVRARMTGIKPMVTSEGAGFTPVSDEEAAEERPFVARSSLRNLTSDFDVDETVTGHLVQEDPAPARVKNWKRELLDLSLRNPLLNLPRGQRLVELLLPSGQLAELDDVLHAGKKVTLLANDALSEVHVAKGITAASELAESELRFMFRSFRQVFISSATTRAKRQLQKLQRTAHTLSQETGSNYLYITLGHLVFTKPNGDEARAPLYLLPVKLRGGKITPYSIRIDGEEIATPNRCLIQWLRNVHGVAFDALNEPPTDEHGIAINTALKDLREQFVEQRVPFRIEETAALAILRFSTFQIWNDLNDNWEELLENSVVNHLVHSPGETFSQPVETNSDFAEEDLLLPVPADSSQMEAVVRTANGESFVLEGPPGTGKSQTITNMIAHLISTGKTVLFVAEKQAALDVVNKRLDATSLSQFALELHGKNQAMSSIRDQLARSLETPEAHSDAANGHQRDWRIEHGKLAGLIRELNQYPERIHQQNSAGESLWTSYQKLNDNDDVPAANIPLSWLETEHDVDAIIDVVVDFSQVAAGELRPAHPWLLACAEPDSASSAQALETAEKLAELLKQVEADADLEQTLNGFPGPNTLQPVTHVLENLHELPPLNSISDLNEENWREHERNVTDAMQSFFSAHQQVLGVFNEHVFDEPQLGEHLARAERLENKFLSDFRLRKQRQFLANHSRHTSATYDSHAAVAALRDINQTQAAGIELLESLRNTRIISLPDQWRPWHPSAAELVQNQLSLTHSYAAVNSEAPHALSSLLSTQNHHPTVIELARVWGAWLKVLSPGELQLSSWASSREDSWVDSWKAASTTWVDDLQRRNFTSWQRMARVNQHVDRLVEHGLTDFASQLLRGEIAPSDAVAAFGHGIARTSFEERSAWAGVDYHDSEHLDRLGAGYNQQAEVIRHLLKTKLPELIINQRPFPPGVLRGEVAELKRQIERKRGGYSFRELTKRYPQAILSLTPCFLMSPGSVAHFLDQASITFDVVIFDEASQIRVPQAVGSLGRAKSAVVVGDSKQMPPTRVMEVRTSVDDPDDTGDEVVVGDLESILSEAVESGLPQHWLSWHYRSSDESLINFSNNFYYDSKLITLPSPRINDARVHLRHVGGLFDRGKSRTNQDEADAIIAEITRRLNDPSHRGESFGVVTFNIQQRDLILTLLEESEDLAVQHALNRTDGEELFVKNLENVQGDERDVVMFSLAYSVDPETGILPLQFGPLLLQGGERRLNVAITRARSEIVLFTSFKASDIDLRRTKSVGMKHLRAYMESIEDWNAATQEVVDDSSQHGRIISELTQRLHDAGLEVKPLLGASRLKVDLAVRQPGAEDWQLAILLDGPRWAGLDSVSDREGFPHLLENLVQWPHVHRLWLPAWLRDSEKEIQRIVDAVEVAASEPEPDASPPVSEDESADRVSVDAGDSIADDEPVPAPDLPELPPLVDDEFSSPGVAENSTPEVEHHSVRQDFVPADTTARAEQKVLNNISGNAQKIAGFVDEVLKTEAPVEMNRLVKILAKKCSYSRVGKAKQTDLENLITSRYRVTDSGGKFVWANDMEPDTWSGYRVVKSTADRSITEVSYQEIKNAAVHILGQAFSVAESEFARDIANELGCPRLIASVAERVNAVVDGALVSEEIVLDSQRYSLPAK